MAKAQHPSLQLGGIGQLELYGDGVAVVFDNLLAGVSLGLADHSRRPAGQAHPNLLQLAAVRDNPEAVLRMRHQRKVLRPAKRGIGQLRADNAAQLEGADFVVAVHQADAVQVAVKKTRP